MASTEVDFGLAIRVARACHNMTLAELSEFSGVSASMLSMLETGARKNPSLKTLERIAVALGVTVSVLLLLAERTDDGYALGSSMLALMKAAKRGQ